MVVLYMKETVALRSKMHRSFCPIPDLHNVCLWVESFNEHAINFLVITLIYIHSNPYPFPPCQRLTTLKPR